MATAANEIVAGAQFFSKLQRCTVEVYAVGDKFGVVLLDYPEYGASPVGVAEELARALTDWEYSANKEKDHAQS
jgi:hypothetical protein